MAWKMLVGVVVAFKCAILIEASFQTFDIEPNLQKNGITEDANTVPEDVYKPPPDLLEDVRLQRLGHHLTEILLHPDQGVPLVYVEQYPMTGEVAEGSEYYSQIPDLQRQANPEVNDVPFKRSRYYRKYPWKRQNSRYDAENRYLCQPSREDVFRLLVALHEARQGNSRTVNFCNRRRPATAVFTNIRFLGRRK